MNPCCACALKRKLLVYSEYPLYSHMQAMMLRCMTLFITNIRLLASQDVVMVNVVDYTDNHSITLCEARRAGVCLVYH